MRERMDKKDWLIALLSVSTVILLIIILIVVIDKKGKESVKKLESSTTIEKEETKKEQEVALTESEKNYFMNEMLPLLDSSIVTLAPFRGASNLSNQDKLLFAMDASNMQDGTYSYKDLQAAVQKAFAATTTLAKEDYICKVDNQVLYQYNKEQDTYTLSTAFDHGHGFDHKRYDVVNQFVSGTITKKEGNITGATIKLRKSFSMGFSDVSAPAVVRFGTYEDAEQNKNQVVDLMYLVPTVEEAVLFQNINTYALEDIAKNQEAYPIYTYQFGYRDGNYYLKNTIHG